MGQLELKTALITGGARGFGRAVALLLAREGADIAVADIAHNLPSAKFMDMAHLDHLSGTVRAIEALGRQAIGIAADVTKSDDCRRMVQTTLDRFGTIDILVANAGVWTHGAAWEFTEDEWDLVVDINLKGTWLTTKYVIPHMIARRRGKIVMTSSIGGIKAYAGLAHYIAAKHGVIGYMKALAIELGPYDINVNAVCPTQMGKPTGPPDPSWERVVGHPHPTAEEFDRAAGQQNLFESWGTPDFSEVAEGVLWLVSDSARLVTGLALPLDAGWVVKRGG